MRRLFPILDQGSLAAGSFLITVFAARELSISHFAAFAALQLIIFLVVGAFRAGPGGWIVVADTRKSIDALGTGLAFIALALGAASSVVIAAVCLLAGMGVQNAIWATSYLICLLVVDALRFRFYRGGEVGAASLLSAGALIALLGIFFLIGPSAAEGILAGAALSYGAVAIPGFLALVKPRLMTTGVSMVMGCGREMGQGTLLGYIGLSTFRLGAPVVMGITGGAVMLASFRGAQTLASIPLQIPESLRLPYLVRGTRLYQENGHLSRPYIRTWPLMLCAVLGPCLILGVVIPDAAGGAVLGDTWQIAKAALPFVVVGAFFNQLTVGIELIARVRGGVRHVARVRMWGGVLGLPVVALAARHGLQIAMAAYAGVCLITWAVAFAGRGDRLTFNSK